MEPIIVLVWTFVGVFIATSIITLCGIVENFKLIQVKDRYLKGLYVALLLEVAAAGVTIASGKLDPIINQPQQNEIDISKIKDEEGVNAVGAMVTNCVNDKPSMLLVMHEKDGRIVYSPPAGKVNPDDNDDFTTAIRETKEETGYSILPKEFLGNSPKGNLNFKMVSAIVDTTRYPDPFFNETIGIVWCDPNDIPVYSWRFPEQREWIIELYEENAPTKCK